MTRMPAALRQAVLRRVEPGTALTRRARRTANAILRHVRAEAASRGLTVRPVLVGSLAKDTHLATPLDIDVFILFPKETPRAALEKEGLALGHAVLPDGHERYAEHPYVHGTRDGFEVDVVPAYRLRAATGRLSAVDRTPFHTRWVGAHATATHRREIRLFKRWLRGVRCYGAETATGGVSGYLAELLVLHHGTFERTLDAIARWKAPVEIRLEGHGHALGGGPLIVVDPVDETRNAGAAVTDATFERLRTAAQAFLREPALSFFFPGTPDAWPPTRLRRLLTRKPTLGVWLPKPTGKAGTELPQAQRLLAKVRRALETEGFTVARAEATLVADHALLLLEHRPVRLPPTRRHEGPSDANAEHRDRFLAKWTGHADAVGRPRLAKGHWTVQVKRPRRTPREVLAGREAELLAGFELPPHAHRDVRVLAGEDLLALTPGRVALTVFLRGLEPWQVPAKES